MTRRRLPQALALVAGFALLAGCGSDEAAPGKTAAPAEAFVCPEPCEFFEIAWAGDILLADAAQPYLDEEGYDWPFDHLHELLDADYTIGNAEGPITTIRKRYNDGQRFHYNAQPESAGTLAAAGFDALGLANNHTLDRGPRGLEDTLGALDQAGVMTFGAGRDAAEAARPLLIETPFGTVAVLAFAEHAVGGAAGEDDAGAMELSNVNLMAGRDRAVDADASWIVAYVHWGENYSNIGRSQHLYAELFAAAGYDLVIGHHPHIAQGAKIISGTPILFSLGNFTFGTSGRFSEEFPGYGLVARTYLGPRGFVGIELTCILTDNDEVRFQPRPCPEDRARSLFEEMGDPVVWKDGLGTVALGP